MKVKRALKAVCFAMILLGIIYLTNSIFKMKDFHESDFSGSINKNFYSLDKKTEMDIMFFGSSTTFHGIVPIEIWKDFGVTAWNWGTPRQGSFMEYYYIREALRIFQPKVIVYDIRGLFYWIGDLLGDYSVQYALYPMKMGKIKLEAISDLRRERDAYAEDLPGETVSQYAFPLYQFHYRWKELGVKDLLGNAYSYRSEYEGSRLAAFELGGGTYRLYAIPQEKIIRDWNAPIVEMAEIHPLALKYFQKTFELCQEYGIPLVLYNAPILDWDMKRHNAGQKLADEYGLKYIDLCVFEEEIGIDPETDMVDVTHLNLWGGVKTSKFLMELLEKEYVFVDKRKDLNYEDWNKVMYDFMKIYRTGLVEEN